MLHRFLTIKITLRFTCLNVKGKEKLRQGERQKKLSRIGGD